ncbi:unnamed protein product [Gulo gulo]|uniref:Uncharacterized protein n=1 Tax=Gulo gulo TaxID=48420 RepID=A0A9X9LCY8_GULGU|nr:unnamed protein product [Gulo gulo]
MGLRAGRTRRGILPSCSPISGSKIIPLVKWLYLKPQINLNRTVLEME